QMTQREHVPSFQQELQRSLSKKSEISRQQKAVPGNGLQLSECLIDENDDLPPPPLHAIASGSSMLKLMMKKRADETAKSANFQEPTANEEEQLHNTLERRTSTIETDGEVAQIGRSEKIPSQFMQIQDELHKKVKKRAEDRMSLQGDLLQNIERQMGQSAVREKSGIENQTRQRGKTEFQQFQMELQIKMQKRAERSYKSEDEMRKLANETTITEMRTGGSSAKNVANGKEDEDLPPPPPHVLTTALPTMVCRN
ncbi:hypothetical protein PMAYCL1PPCAC_14625, partial [Pristionchus mayeri]